MPATPIYLDHYGLRETPFALTPDTQYFYFHPGHHQALNALLVAIQSGEGLIKVTGEVGTGKTLLCRMLMSSLGDGYQLAYLPNPALQPGILRLALAEELGIRVDVAMDQHRLAQTLNQRLLELRAEGRQVVVCVDEAQTLPDASLEALRLLTNLETEKSKLLQLVLFGQPELDAKLSQPRLRQVRQRVTCAIDLPALDRAAVAGYLGHRLQVAGYQGAPLFCATALDCMHRCSRGVPRLLNVIANKALMLAYGRGEHRISADCVRAAAIDTEDASYRQETRREHWLNFGVGASAAALAASAWYWWSLAA